MQSRSEQQRAAWLRDHPHHDRSGRRRAVLERRAGRAKRRATSTEATASEGLPPRSWRGAVAHEDGNEHLFRVGVLLLALLMGIIAAGDAAIYAMILYGGWWLMVPRVGRIRVLPLLVLGMGGAVTVTLTHSYLSWAGWWDHLPPVFDAGTTIESALLGRLPVAVTLALLLAALYARLAGWSAPAVRRSGQQTSASSTTSTAPTLAMPQGQPGDTPDSIKSWDHPEDDDPGDEPGAV